MSKCWNLHVGNRWHHNVKRTSKSRLISGWFMAIYSRALELPSTEAQLSSTITSVIAVTKKEGNKVEFTPSNVFLVLIPPNVTVVRANEYRNCSSDNYSRLYYFLHYPTSQLSKITTSNTTRFCVSQRCLWIVLSFAYPQFVKLL